jgi:hypothetical protein
VAPRAAIRVPIAAAKRIADDYGYDQVVIFVRKVGPGGGEHMTTYGTTKEHCRIAAMIGAFLKFKVMGWIKEAYAAQGTKKKTPSVVLDSGTNPHDTTVIVAPPPTQKSDRSTAKKEPKV